MLTGHFGALTGTGTAFGPGGHILATVSVDGTARLWDIRRQETVATLSGHTGAVWGSRSAPTGTPWPPPATTTVWCSGVSTARFCCPFQRRR
ncbi:hypothetical protein FDA94_00450 [Herbidospora galbida]|uniref:Uncharacterized protein n=1 Tax=Herbidospora galbida TaxID=2575442 RepID=A0A4U3MNU3_9ACTN|nr:hypothetical protein FDA94_00450 [Herbidospora galbida]